MTTSKNYKYGKYTCKAYKKPVGKGFEVGFTFGNIPVFVGNFIHTTEANGWWTMMNKEINRFSKKYWTTQNAPMAWYSKFLSHYLYKCYYNFLEGKFTKYHRTFNKAVKTHERKYTSWRKFTPTATTDRLYFRKAA
ncbi:MAG: hypothetical protein SGJ18_06640 [Pseudomonadota bacterium]|nr:hypothetical protein [Pseudomonadota bacterium]